LEAFVAMVRIRVRLALAAVLALLAVLLPGPAWAAEQVHVTGVVRDAYGSPVVGATVQTDLQPADGIQPSAVTTDREGRYDLAMASGTIVNYLYVFEPNLPDAVRAASATTPRFPDEWAFGIEARTTPLSAPFVHDFTLPKVVGVTVSVVDDAGAPSPGAEVQVRGWRVTDQPYGLDAVESTDALASDAQGTARAVAFESLNLTTRVAWAFGAEEVSQPIAAQDITVAVTLPPVATFSGVLRDAEGSPVAGASVEVVGRDLLDGWATQASVPSVTDVHGHYTTRVSSGQVSVTVSGGRVSTSTTPLWPQDWRVHGISLSLSGDTVKDLTLPKVVKVRVLAADTLAVPVNGVSVEVRGDWEEGGASRLRASAIDNAVTDMDGVAEARTFDASQVSVMGSSRVLGSTRHALATSESAPDDLELALTFPAVPTVSGVVRDGFGSPVVGAAVTASGASGDSDPSATDARGRYRVAVELGTVSIGVSGDDASSSTTTHWPAGWGVTGSLAVLESTVQDLALPKVVQVEVSVVDGSSTPVQGAGVRIHTDGEHVLADAMSGSRSYTRAPTVLTASDGVVVGRGFDSSSLTVGVSSEPYAAEPDYTEFSFAAAAGDRSVVVTLPQSGDADADGIQDVVDTEPQQPSSDFRDGAGHFGTIREVPSGLSVTVEDLPDPTGVRVLATGSSDLWAVLDLCGGFMVQVSGGSHVDVDCGSVRLQVGQGEVEIVLDGVTVIRFPEDSDGRVSSSAGATTVENLGTVPLTISVDGVSRSLAGGASTPVQAWRFVGFTQPVDPLPTLNQVKAGQAVPLRWRLLDSSGAPVTSLSSASVSVTPLACESHSAVDALEESAAEASSLKHLGDGQYQLNWKTSTTYAGSCLRLRLDVGDGVTHDADFTFGR
jgi:hypothetical protein